MHRLLVMTLVVACTKPTPTEPPRTAASTCPSRDRPMPLLPPGATPIPGRGMATTINPGMNTSEEYYRLLGMSARAATDFYRRCLPPDDATPSIFSEPVEGGDAGSGAMRSYEVTREAGETVVRVRCSRCY